MQKTSWSNRNVYIWEDRVYKIPKISFYNLKSLIDLIIWNRKIDNIHYDFFKKRVINWFLANKTEKEINEKIKENSINSIISKVKFSIPYILNVQEKCEVIRNIFWTFFGEDIKLCIKDVKLFYSEWHTFLARENYWIINWKIVILDYGWEYMLEIFEKYWENIKNWFDKSSFYYIKIEHNWNLLDETQKDEITWILNKKYNYLDEKLEVLVFIYDKYFKKYE